MQAVILAAGMGKRLGKLTDSDTKCMVEVNGIKLIDRLLDSINAVGVNRVVIVVGYKSEKVMSYVGDNWKGTPIIFVENENYDKTNNIYSLFLASSYLKTEDTILFESDVIFEHSIIQRLVDSDDPNLAVVAPYENWMDGTVVELDANRYIQNFVNKTGFIYENFDKYFKTVNIYKFSEKFLVNTYIPFLKAYTEVFGNNEYYEEVLKLIVNVQQTQLKALVLGLESWYEIDTLEDLDTASSIFSTGSEQVSSLLKRHGGYWRFPRVLDFCYLVNPFFPSTFFINELAQDFELLTRNYPSTSRIHERIIASYYGIEESQVVIGNGASELIANLARVLPGKRLGYFVPAFEEYRLRFHEFEQIQLLAPLDNLGSRFQQIIDEIERFDIFVIVNPDNPTGFTFSEHEILHLIEIFKKSRKVLVVDESFIDFSNAGEAATLIKSSIITDNPHLVIIKSISKSFGIPGIRLGVVATSDLDLCGNLRKLLPVWNINSFAEMFLQKLAKYRKEYLAACIDFVAERHRFYSLLIEIDTIYVFPSQANFFMIRINNGVPASKLTLDLLKNNILIRDLTGKIGIDSDSYIRIAIRSHKDNDVIISALKNLL
jgi:histidinol-phosphate/aromatic aminotransferase/cobyric acid decarboxylase-like protein/choline kinase